MLFLQKNNKMKLIKIAIISILFFITYTKIGTNFPKGSDYFLHLFGGVLVAWLFEKPLVYFALAIAAELAQPILCPSRSFEIHDIVMNIAGCLCYFLSNNLIKNKHLLRG